MANRDLKIYVGGELLDLEDRFTSPFYVTLQVADLENLDKRGGFASNTITVPATKNNCLIFERYNDWQKNDSETFRDAKEVETYVKGERIFKGFIYGKSTEILKEAPVNFKARITSNNLSWAQTLKNKSLASLTFGEITHNEATIIAGWNATYPQHYCTPLAHYGGGKSHPCYVVNKNYWRYWINARRVTEEIFKEAGYKLNSSFFQGAAFSKMFFYLNDNDYYHAFKDDFTDRKIDLIAAMISPDRSMLDFVKGIQQLFNIFFYTDEDNREIFAEPFNTFIDASRTTNLDGMVDSGSKIEKSPITEVKQKTTVSYDAVENDGARLMRLFFGDSEYFKAGFKGTAGDQEEVKDFQNPFFGALPMVYFPSHNTALTIQSPEIDTPITTNGQAVNGNTFRQSKVYMPYVADSGTNFFQVIDKSYTGFFVRAFFGGDYQFAFQKWYTKYSPYFFEHFGERGSGAVKPVIGSFAGMQPVNPGNYYSAAAANGNIIEHKAGGGLTFETNTRPYIYSVDHVLEDPAEDSEKINLNYDNETQFNQQQQLEASPKLLKGLFSNYFASYLKSIQSSSLYKVPVAWRPTDIRNLDFRKLVAFKNQLFILLKIDKYRPELDSTATTSLLKYQRINDPEEELVETNPSTMGDFDEIFYFVRGLTEDEQNPE